MSARSAKRRVEVHVFPAFRAAAPASLARRAAAAALAAADPDGERGASVVVADDDTLRDLNRRFRGLDEVTDVLSFGERGAPIEEGSAFLSGARACDGGAPLEEGGAFPLSAALRDGNGDAPIEEGSAFLPGGASLGEGARTRPNGDMGGDGSPAEFPAIPGETPSLGEVALSYPYAARQAASRGIPVEREVALLVVHGVLHLLGHDHAELDEAAAMRALEEEALAALFASGSRSGGALGVGDAGGAPFASGSRSGGALTDGDAGGVPFASGSRSGGALGAGDARGAPFASGSRSGSALGVGEPRGAPFASAVGAGAR